MIQFKQVSNRKNAQDMARRKLFGRGWSFKFYSFQIWRELIISGEVRLTSKTCRHAKMRISHTINNKKEEPMEIVFASEN